MTTGNTDLWYKIQNGYYDYAKGKAQGGLHDLAFINGRGFAYVRSLWEDVLLPYHQSNPDVDTDSDGTPDAAEIRLGLNPADPGSRFFANIIGNTLEWAGANGTIFVVQRSGSMSGNWETIATVPGTSGLVRYVDASPLPDQGFYRIGLKP